MTSFIQCCGTVTIYCGTVPVSVPTFWQVTVTVPVPAPYLDHKKQFSKNNFCKRSCLLMLIEAALLPRNLSSPLLWFHFITVPVPQHPFIQLCGFLYDNWIIVVLDFQQAFRLVLQRWSWGGECSGGGGAHRRGAYSCHSFQPFHLAAVALFFWVYWRWAKSCETFTVSAVVLKVAKS